MFRVPSVLTSRSEAPPSQSRGRATRWRTASTPSKAGPSCSKWVTSAWRSSTLARCADVSLPSTSWSSAASRVSATTRCPASSRAGTTWLPMNPLAPVTRMVDMTPYLRADRPGGWPAAYHRSHDATRSEDAAGADARDAEGGAAPPPRRVAPDRHRPRPRADPRREGADNVRGDALGPRGSGAGRRPGPAPARVRPADRADAGRRGAGADGRGPRRGQGARQRPLRRDPLGAAPAHGPRPDRARRRRSGLAWRAVDGEPAGHPGPADRDADALARARGEPRLRRGPGHARVPGRARGGGPRGAGGALPGSGAASAGHRARPIDRPPRHAPRGGVGWRGAGQAVARAGPGPNRTRAPVDRRSGPGPRAGPARHVAGPVSHLEPAGERLPHAG